MFQNSELVKPLIFLNSMLDSQFFCAQYTTRTFVEIVKKLRFLFFILAVLVSSVTG